MKTLNTRFKHRVNCVELEDIDALKRAEKGEPRYRLANANVFVSPGGFHYIDYLDPEGEIPPGIPGDVLTEQDIAYIEKQLQSNEERYAGEVALVKRYAPVQGRPVLDIGCGGGLFLARLREEGAIVTGIELSDSRAQYARMRHAIEIIRHPIESAYWRERPESFDVVTIWDVIEHVNFPLSTLRGAASVLRRGGMMFIDTPCRDNFYHRAGATSYYLSNGRYPTFLDTMYSAHRFGHKQIFSMVEIHSLLREIGLEILTLEKFHELSFPYSFYLKRLLKSDTLVKLALPIVKAGDECAVTQAEEVFGAGSKKLIAQVSCQSMGLLLSPRFGSERAAHRDQHLLV